jgi:GNAT superfamily N-acetyltransferase
MKINDMKRAIILLENEWDLGSRSSGASRKLCAWIYLIEILEETERFVYYREEGRLVGFAGYSNNHKRHPIRKLLCGIIRCILYRSKEIKDLNALKEYYANYDEYIPDYLEGYFDGEVSILILDKSYRGKNIGKKILLQVFELAKNDDMHNLQILTDESCNYKFYEKAGCKKVYETVVENKECCKLGNSSNEKAFIYEIQF